MITESKVKEIADLAQLKLTDEEVKLFAGQLARVIEHFDKLSSLNIDQRPPIVTATDIEFRARPDEVAPYPNSAERVLANAPERKNALFKVPPVV